MYYKEAQKIEHERRFWSLWVPEKFVEAIAGHPNEDSIQKDPNNRINGKKGHPRTDLSSIRCCHQSSNQSARISGTQRYIIVYQQ
jgi:hypothetical protein